MTHAQRLATFASGARYDALSEAARRTLKIRVLDSLACALGALEGPPVRRIREHTDAFGGAPLATLIGGGRTAPDRAAFYNGALVRYLDFNDGYLAPGETCHPSDNLAPVLAAAEYAESHRALIDRGAAEGGGLPPTWSAAPSGRDFLTALAVAYQVQCRLSDEAPVRDKGFDHTTQGSFAAAAGVSRALGLDAQRTANALAIAGTAFNALRVTRTGGLSNWKGLAYPNTAFGATHAAFLAMRKITGPAEVFEGNKGFMESISGPFEVDWAAEDLERVTHTIHKRFNAEIHAQSAIEAALELRVEHGFTGADVDRVEVGVFQVAFDIIGGGEEGDKTIVRTKEEADHSLRYMVAVALLDGNVLPPQYRQERIVAPDVQSLLRRVTVRPNEEFSRRFPAEHACRVTVFLEDGRSFTREKADYEGFTSRPASWETARRKFDALALPFTTAAQRDAITAYVDDLENLPITGLTKVLAAVGRSGRAAEPEKEGAF